MVMTMMMVVMMLMMVNTVKIKYQPGTWWAPAGCPREGEGSFPSQGKGDLTSPGGCHDDDHHHHGHHSHHHHHRHDFTWLASGPRGPPAPKKLGLSSWEGACCCCWASRKPGHYNVFYYQLKWPLFFMPPSSDRRYTRKWTATDKVIFLTSNNVPCSHILMFQVQIFC